MKSNGDGRGKGGASIPADAMRRATKLQPLKKSGKEKRSIILALDEDEGDDLYAYRKRESVLDYYDDNEEDTVLDEIDRIIEKEDSQDEGLDDVGEEEWEEYDNYEEQYEKEWDKIQEFSDEAETDNY